MKRLGLLGLFVLIACHRGSPLGPTPLSSPVASWSPYVGVHPYGGDHSPQLPYLDRLITAGQVRGIRADVDDPDSEAFARWASGRGLEVLAVFPNEHLQQPNAWEVLNQQITRNPQIRYWEIGNEVQGFLQMGGKVYMAIFWDLYLKAQQYHPEVVLIPQAPVGVIGGEDSMQEMLDNGLLELAQHHGLQLVAVHFYSAKSTFIGQMQAQLQRLPSTVQVWVTESGSTTNQSQFVEEIYPMLHNRLRATRIYWYVLSECSSPSGDYSLVHGLPQQCQLKAPQFSDLYQALTEGTKP